MFYFLKYLQPIHYFRKSTYSGLSVFPRFEDLPNTIKNQLKTDQRYDSSESVQLDLSWQAIQRGFINSCSALKRPKNDNLKDNYLFIRKNFHSAWVLYVLILRLVLFKNPIHEFKSWYGTRYVRRHHFYEQFITYDDFDSIAYSYQETNPLISVIIPTLNRYEYLKDVLHDFEQQDYNNFEILVVDQSDKFNPTFYADFNLDLKVIRQEEKALWLARNTAIEHSNGTLIALSEDDVRIKSDWLSQHLKCLEYFNADVSAGVFYPQGQSIPQERSYFCMASQFATGNAMLYKRVFEQVGLFDRQFEKQRMGDAEFGMRVYLQGLLSVSNPMASCIDVKAGTGGLRDMGSWDAFRPKNIFAPRPIPSVLYYSRRYFGTKASISMLLKTIPTSIIPYQFKKSRPLMVVGVVISLLLFPFVVIQVLSSWYLSGIKLKEGPQIKRLSL